MTRPVISRALSGLLEVADDGRTVDGRIVPYDEPAEIYDTNHPDHLGELFRYWESFAPAALDRQIAFIESKFGGVAKYVRFNLDHATDLGRQIGYARELVTRDDGGYAVFRLYERSDLTQIQSMLSESHTGLSVEFHDYNPAVSGDLVVRRSVNVVAVAATPAPAYSAAGVVSVREDMLELPELATPRLDTAKQWFPRG